MGTIFTISKKYLSSLLEESEKFSFKLQGYSNFSDALIGIIKVNIVDLQGFIYLDDKAETNLEDFKKFILLCNNICQYKPLKFIIALKDGQGIVEIVKGLKVQNLKMRLVDEFAEITDTLINNRLYASILSDNKNPYLIDGEKEENSLILGNTNFIKYQSLFSSNTLSILDKPAKMENKELTKRQDLLYQSYLKLDSILAMLREIQIDTMFGETDHKKEENVMININKINDSWKYCEYTALLYIVQGG